MKIWYLLPVSLVIGSLIFFFLGGIPLLLIFGMLWFDKIVLKSVTPGILGTELTTLSTILLGMSAGPFMGLVLVMVTIPILEGIKGIVVPIPAFIPPFVPTPYHLVDGIIAFMAGFFIGFPFLAIVLTLLIVKFMANATIDTYFTAKPFDILSALTSTIFNVLIVLYLETMIFTFII